MDRIWRNKMVVAIHIFGIIDYICKIIAAGSSYAPPQNELF